jgi:hypothetical protein
MSKMSNLHFSLVEEIVLGQLSFREIAEKHEVPFSWVDAVAKELAEEDEAMYYAEAQGSR